MQNPNPNLNPNPNPNLSINQTGPELFQNASNIQTHCPENVEQVDIWK
jgi:hypothetical protein